MCSKGAHRTQALALSLGEPMTAGGAYTSRLERLSLAVFAWTSATRDQQGSDFFLISSTNIRKATTISSLPPFHCFFRSVSICCYVLAVFWYLDFQNLLATQLPKCLDLLLSSFIARFGPGRVGLCPESAMWWYATYQATNGFVWN